MNEIRINKYSINLPSAWEELSPKDLIFLGRLFPFKDTAQFHLQVFLHFCNLKWKPLLGYTIYRLKPEELHSILSLDGKGAAFAFLFADPVMRKVKLREFSHKYIRFFGPGDELRNMRMGEFRYAEACLESYLKTNSADSLNDFVAVLYRTAADVRHPGVTSDVRIPFDWTVNDNRAEFIADLSAHLKRAIVLQYIAMRGYLMERNPVVFVKQDPESGRSPEKGAGSNWGEIINAMAESVINKSEIEEKLVWDVLEWMADAMKRNKKKSKKQPVTE